LGTTRLTFVTSTQKLSGSNPALVGGIPGSYPFSGGYGRFCYLNWAAKFYGDASMEWLKTQFEEPPLQHPIAS